MLKRHSVRKYSNYVIPDNDIESILSASNSAPSAGNLQPYRIFVIRGGRKKASVSECARGQEFVKEASLILVFAADPDTAFEEYGERGRSLYCIQDATIAATFAVLKATDLGYSTAWIGQFDENRLKQEIDAVGYIPIAIILIGKAGEAPRKTSRKKLSEIAHYVD